MALMTIRLIRDPQSGKQNIIVKLDSDSDSLPMEHENLHRKLVEQLVGAGQKLEDLGEIRIERDGTPAPVSEPDSEPIRERAKQAISKLTP